MTKYKIKIEPEALKDIQATTDWYNEQLQGLGSRFQKQVILQIDSLKGNPSAYAVRYAEVRCMIIKKFPFMVHFAVNDNRKLVEVFGIFHTSRNPKIWEERKK